MVPCSRAKLSTSLLATASSKTRLVDLHREMLYVVRFLSIGSESSCAPWKHLSALRLLIRSIQIYLMLWLPIVVNQCSAAACHPSVIFDLATSWSRSAQFVPQKKLLVCQFHSEALLVYCWRNTAHPCHAIAARKVLPSLNCSLWSGIFKVLSQITGLPTNTRLRIRDKWSIRPVSRAS